MRKCRQLKTSKHKIVRLVFRSFQTGIPLAHRSALARRFGLLFTFSDSLPGIAGFADCYTFVPGGWGGPSLLARQAYDAGDGKRLNTQALHGCLFAARA